MRFDQLGPLEIIEVYAFYDRPLLYCARSTTNRLYLVLLIEQLDEEEHWLYVEVSEQRFSQVRAGSIDLHTAFRLPESGHVLIGTLPLNENKLINTRYIEAEAIDEQQLPANAGADYDEADKMIKIFERHFEDLCPDCDGEGDMP